MCEFFPFKKINVFSITSFYCIMWYQKREKFPFTFSSITYNKVRTTHWIWCTAEPHSRATQTLSLINFGVFIRDKIYSTISQDLNTLNWNSKSLWAFSLDLLRRVYCCEKVQMENWNFMSLTPTITIWGITFLVLAYPWYKFWQMWKTPGSFMVSALEILSLCLFL